MPIGPHGEKRPVSVVQNAHKVYLIATGQAEEEYVGGRPHTDPVPDRIAAMQVAKTKAKKRKKGKRPTR